MKIAIRTYSGLEDILKEEIQKITDKNVSVERRAVSLEGDIDDIYKINLWSRYAIDVLVTLHSFKASHEDILYKYAHQFPWEKYLSEDQTFSISSIVHSRFFKHSKYASLKVKDALVDRFRKKYGKRPNVERDNPDLNFVVRISEDNVNILWNTSGSPLYKRGYRKLSGETPLNEILAASILEFTNWEHNTPLIDPMCGSGTFIAEAIMRTCNIAPGILRNSFGFEKSSELDLYRWNSIKEEAHNLICNSSALIYGYDISNTSVSMTKENINTLNANVDVKIEQADYFKLTKPSEKGMILMNPPYDQRLRNNNIIEFYNDIGSRLKHFWENYDAWVFSGNLGALKRMGLKPNQKKILFNGPLECKLLHFPIYKGSLKRMKS